MHRFFPAAAVLASALCLAAPAAAEQLGSYFMSIHPQDMTNSRGQRLSGMGAVLQQDRANFHRFGRPGPSDEYDRFFGDAGARAQIPALYAAGPGNRHFDARPPSPGRANFADYLISVCGSGGRITHIIVDYADGDGHRGC